jgi:hypothetical protein
VTENDKLKVWTIFKSPEDYPGEFVARCFIAEAAGVVPTTEIIRGKSLEQLQEHFAQWGLVRVPRDPNDTSSTVEVWF